MSGIGRASVLIGAGTIVSRLTGFLRAVVLVSAVGATTGAGNAFAIANQLPNNIYAIISTGLLTAVIVPQIVKAAQHDDGGRAFVSKLFTLGTVVLVVVTALATIAAPWLVRLYAPGFPPDQQALATAFAYWCLPQILFYGLYALVGEALNARRVFGPFTWAPIVNNVVSIAGFVVFILLFGSTEAVEAWTPEMVALLAGTATFGIVVQAVILLMFWRRTGLHVRPDFRWRGVGLNHLGRLAGLDVPDGRGRSARRPRAVPGALRGRPGQPRRPRHAERLAVVHAPVLDHRALDRNPVLHAAQRARRRRP